MMRRNQATKRFVLRDPVLKKRQKVHAWLLIVLPLAGVLALPVFSYFYGIRASDLLLFIAFYILSLCGITVGYHRHFSHRTFEARSGVRLLFGILGSMAAQGPVTYWVSNHRRHHWDSDGIGDPHSPRRRGEEELSGWSGFWHSHLGWTYSHDVTNSTIFARELVRDPVARFLNRTYFWWVALGLLLPALIGGLANASLAGAVGGFLWGGPVRIFFAFHGTSLINSAGHLAGRRMFDTADTSTNLWWLALPTLGESWHNNHHAFPKSAVFGLAWWQVDLGGYVIRCLGRTGLATSVMIPDAERIRRRREGGRKPARRQLPAEAAGDGEPPGRRA